MKYIVILSGGMDSTTLLYDLFSCGNNEISGVLTFNYGQKHKKEIDCAKKTCKKLGLEHHIVDLTTLKPLLKSALTDSNQKIPEGHYENKNMIQTVVPNRNMIMLSIATGYAISKGANTVVYGAHAGDYTIYPDCRPEFVEQLNKVTQICDYHPVKIIAPYSKLTKDQILSIGKPLKVPYQDTWTCYKGKKEPCGKCGACRERAEAFNKNNLIDPLYY